jgi:hypothetical protein
MRNKVNTFYSKQTILGLLAVILYSVYGLFSYTRTIHIHIWNHNYNGLSDLLELRLSRI